MFVFGHVGCLAFVCTSRCFFRAQTQIFLNVYSMVGFVFVFSVEYYRFS